MIHSRDKYGAVLNFLNVNDQEDLIRHLKERRTKIHLIEGENAFEKETFLEQYTASLPENVPVTNWTQFEDSMRGLFRTAVNRERAIIWTDTDRILEKGLKDFITITDVFYRVARNSVSNGLRFRIFFVGSGANFQ